MIMHQDFMMAALHEAWQGRGRCAPNPAVGAVAVYDGRIIGKACHWGPGMPHAEVTLLNDLKDQAEGIDLYVTLEPCNHWGKTPPCVDAIIQKKVRRVIYGYADPNPIVVQGDSVARLHQAGIEVHHMPLVELDRFYESYTRWVHTGYPTVTVKMAQSLDGKIASEFGKPYVLSNDACFEWTHQHRLHADILLTTARTICTDDPMLNVRLEPMRAVSKPVAVLDTHGRMPLDARCIREASTCLVYQAYRETAVVDGIAYYAVPRLSLGLDLYAVFRHLGYLGYHDVWVEAGARLFQSLHRLGCVHTTYLYVTPHILGEKACSLYQGAESWFKDAVCCTIAQGDNVIFQWKWKNAILDFLNQSTQES